MTTPQFPVPEGWFTFGTHVDSPQHLEFSREYGEDMLPLWERPCAGCAVCRTLFDVAREVTDEALGQGTYAKLHASNPDPGVQAAIERGKR